MIHITRQRVADWLLLVAAFGFGLFAQAVIQERQCQDDKVFWIFDRQYHCYEVEPVGNEDLRLMQVWHGRL